MPSCFVFVSMDHRKTRICPSLLLAGWPTGGTCASWCPCSLSREGWTRGDGDRRGPGWCHDWFCLVPTSLWAAPPPGPLLPLSIPRASEILPKTPAWTHLTACVPTAPYPRPFSPPPCGFSLSALLQSMSFCFCLKVSLFPCSTFGEQVRDSVTRSPGSVLSTSGFTDS